MTDSKSARFVVGVPRLDEQHDQLLRLAREMRAAFEQRRPLGELRRLAALFTLHTRMHFMDEEMFMEGAGYPGLQAHRQRHAEFTDGLLRLQTGLRSTNHANFTAIVEYELKWIRCHLEEEDDELGRWLRESELFAAHEDWECEAPPSSIPTSPQAGLRK